MKTTKGFANIIIIGVIALTAFAIGSFFSNYKKPVQNVTQVLGDFNPTGGQTYRLQSSISTTQSTITLTSFKEPVSNIKYTMTYLNSAIEYGTIDPSNSSTKEFISFTGITQNSDNTATLTGVSRGLGFSYPYTASTTLAQSHSGQSIFILSNPPQLTNMYANKSNNENIAGIWNFMALPTTTVTCSTSIQFCNKAYVDSVAVAGASNADDSTKGIVEMATAAEASAGTSLGSTGARLTLGANLATSTPTTSCSAFCVVVATAGKIAQGFLDLTANFSWSGNHNFTGTTYIKNANASSTVANPLTLNGLTFSTQSARAASSTVLTEDGSGHLLFLPPTGRQFVLIDTNDIAPSNSFATSTLGLTIPPNTLNASSTIRVDFATSGACTTTSGSCTIYVKNSAGATLVQFGFATDDNTKTTYDAIGYIIIASNNSSNFSAQTYIASATYTNSTPMGVVTNAEGTASMDFTQSQTLKIVGQTTTGSFTIPNYSIVVNP